METTFYDQVAYGGNAIRLTAPNSIAGIAAILGLDAPPPQDARVLELGCGNAANLVPLASYWPRARFVGIDLAPSAIAEGRETISALGLQNLEIEVGDIADLQTQRLGEFDYVIAHGVLSWVPRAVREALLATIGRVLSPRGVGYVSYNAMPGCRVRHLVRDLLQFRLEGQDYSPAIIGPAWRFLEGMRELPPAQDLGFFAALRREAIEAMDVSPQFLFHDDLSPDNEPFYLHQFAARAAAHGLAAVGDADLESMREPAGQPELSRWLEETSAGDWVARQQYVDFIRGARFKRTLVTRSGALPAPRWDSARIADARWYSELAPEGDVRLDDDSEARFSGTTQRGVTTNHPLLKAALMLAHRSLSGTVTTAELAATLHAGAQPAGATQDAAGAVLLRLAHAGLVSPVAQPWPGRAPAPAGEHSRPRITPLARLLLERGEPLVDSAHHNIALAEPWIGKLALEMDGSTSVVELCARAQALRAPDGAPTTDPRESLVGLESLVAMFARRGLLASVQT